MKPCKIKAEKSKEKQSRAKKTLCCHLQVKASNITKQPFCTHTVI